MEKKTYFVIEEKSIKTGNTFARALKIPNCYNLVGYFQPHKDWEIVSINACDTYKKAQEIATFWNDNAKSKNELAIPV